MKLSISTKLFAAVFASVLLVILAMSAATGWSFQRGFIGYLNDQGITRLEKALPRLAEFYVQEGSWERFRNDPRQLFELMLPIPGVDFPLDIPPEEAMMPDSTGALFRTALLDAQQQRVAGYRKPGAEAILRPILLDGNTVGWLALAPFQSVSEGGGEIFRRYHLNTSLIVGLGSLLLATLIAWWISRTLLGPVKRIAAATHRLAAGEYNCRVSVASQDEVGQLARDFNQLALTLERNERMRRDFMADVSHELRTPLAILRGELEALEDGVRPLNRTALWSLQTEVGLLGKLIEDLYELSLADVGALTYRKSKADVGALLSQSVELFRERSLACCLSLELKLPARPYVLEVDTSRMQQLFSNLLENSMRYTTAGGGVHVSLRPDPHTLIIDIFDSAPGVSAEQLPRLFERFYRGDISRNRANGGAGLGLSICRNIVEAHGGQINAAHSPEGGLWLSIQLPWEN
ncbi:HAMP domain-containing protein [Pseudomonas sp. CCM 7891]|uniref:histidine kinase n=2 Tax=Pseudomonas karstica TaxID=1055468 RepID=A0A7X2RUZ1_9PSED|nr:HAMP domain-containing protein [Pseudomonas karstica]